MHTYHAFIKKKQHNNEFGHLAEFTVLPVNCWRTWAPQPALSHQGHPEDGDGAPEAAACNEKGKAASQLRSKARRGLGDRPSAWWFLTAGGVICNTTQTRLAHCRNSIFRITSARCTLTTKVSAASAPHLQQYCIYAAGVPTPIYIRCEGETLSNHQITSSCKSTQHTAGGEVLTTYLPFACRSTPRGVS